MNPALHHPHGHARLLERGELGDGEHLAAGRVRVEAERLGDGRSAVELDDRADGDLALHRKAGVSGVAADGARGAGDDAVAGHLDQVRREVVLREDDDVSDGGISKAVRILRSGVERDPLADAAGIRELVFFHGDALDPEDLRERKQHSAFFPTETVGSIFQPTTPGTQPEAKVPPSAAISRTSIYLSAFLGGVAALSWEILWQHYSALALGISAAGTAITLAVTMAGMTAGSLAAGWVLSRRRLERPLLWYGLIEVSIGLLGQDLAPAFSLIAELDTYVFRAVPSAAGVLHAFGIALVIGPAAVAMGATLPVLGLVARACDTSLSRLYAANTAGAAVGVLLIALFFLPTVGVGVSAGAISSINLLAGLIAVLLSARTSASETQVELQAVAEPVPYRAALGIALMTGLVTFMLEVSWFRSLRAAFWSYTDSFAVILFSVLIALAIGARLAAILSRRRFSIGVVLAAAGVLVLLATPLIERADTLVPWPIDYTLRMLLWLAASTVMIGLPITVLAACLPWLLDAFPGERRWAGLYSANTIGAVLGALVAAWVLLPRIGSVAASWIAGSLLVLLAIVLSPRRRWTAAAAGLGALAIAIAANSGAGSIRVQGRGIGEAKVLESNEGPDSTSTVIELPDGTRKLIIDGFEATAEHISAQAYMTWMGHLPMLLHRDPQLALVICFGTGTTANAVRTERPKQLHIVELDPNVLEVAHYFTVNQQVLEDPRVRAIAMDGRAWLRRTSDRYDVVTLEPMPPNFAGVNSLYSAEFYGIVSNALNDGGIVAQWLPFHLVTVDDAVSIAAAFAEVFPDAILWISPNARSHGILLGRKGEPTSRLGDEWPGFERHPDVLRPLPKEAVRAAVTLDPRALRLYAEAGVAVTDDNQRLSYGDKRMARHEHMEEIAVRSNLEFLTKIAQRAEKN
jgi:spermidine synthase